MDFEAFLLLHKYNVLWSEGGKCDRKCSAYKSFHNKGWGIQTAWINKMLQKSLLWSPDSQKHSFKLLNDLGIATIGLLPSFNLATTQGIYVKKSFRLLSRNQPYFDMVAFRIREGCPCLILIQAASYILTIWRYHNAISQQIQDQEEKTFSPTIRNPFGILCNLNIFCRKWGISRLFKW